jgi:ABC-2 type transport system ATP-binding protein
MNAAIRLEGLTKTYANGKKALDGVSLTIPQGIIFGLLGPNGAGKSTIINILAGLVDKNHGHVSIWGHDIDQDRRNAKMSIGVVPQELVFDAFFTPHEVLELQAGLYGVPKQARQTAALLDAVHLADKAHAYARTLSGGMKRRLLVAKAMVHQPPILVLDEPTAGVDIELRQQLWAYVRTLHARGVTVVLTTHYLEEAQELCDEIAIINHGQIVAHAPTQTLLAQANDKVLLITLEGAADQAVPTPKASSIKQLKAQQWAITYDKTKTNAGAILSEFAQAGLSVRDVTTQEADLEDVFLKLTRSKPRAEPVLHD